MAVTDSENNIVNDITSDPPSTSNTISMTERQVDRDMSAILQVCSFKMQIYQSK